MAATADRMEQIAQIPDAKLRGTIFGSKQAMKRFQRSSGDGELIPLPTPGKLDYGDGEPVQVDTFADLLIAYAFWPERP